MAEWLRRWTRNPLGSPRAGWNPADYGNFFFFVLNVPALSAGKNLMKSVPSAEKKKKMQPVPWMSSAGKRG